MPHTTLGAFTRRLDVAIKKIPRQTSNVIGGVTAALQQVLIETTPVNTGRARTNWRVYTTVENTIIDTPTNPESGAAEALAQGLVTIRANPTSLEFNIVNNVDYIETLNRGSSLQAPANFILIAIDASADYLNKNPIKILDL